MERLGALFEELDDRRIEADRDGARHLEHQSGTPGRTAPALVGAVAMPRAVHAQMGPDLEAVVEPDEQVLAERFDCGDLPPDDPIHPGHGTRPAGPGRDDRPSDQVRPQAGRGPEEGVALGHFRSRAGRPRLQLPDLPFEGLDPTRRSRWFRGPTPGRRRVGRSRLPAAQRSPRSFPLAFRRVHRVRRSRNPAKPDRTTRPPGHARTQTADPHVGPRRGLLEPPRR